jgi:hypothetical protein
MKSERNGQPPPGGVGEPNTGVGKTPMTEMKNTPSILADQKPPHKGKAADSGRHDRIVGQVASGK